MLTSTTAETTEKIRHRSSDGSMVISKHSSFDLKDDNQDRPAPLPVRFQSITLSDDHSDLSFEEIRYNDYQEIKEHICKHRIQQTCGSIPFWEAQSLKHVVNSKHTFVFLNVGGTPYVTSLVSITKCPGTRLFRRCERAWINKMGRAADAPIYLDRDGLCFRYILNYLRDGLEAAMPQCEETLRQLCLEAEFFQLVELTEQLQRRLAALM